MLDRILRLPIVLTLLLFLLQAVTGVLARVLEAALRNTMSVLGSVGGFLAQLLVGAAVVIFMVGLLIRFAQWVRGNSSRRRPGHAQGSHEWAGREFADEVPVDRTSRHRSRSVTRRRS